MTILYMILSEDGQYITPTSDPDIKTFTQRNQAVDVLNEHIERSAHNYNRSKVALRGAANDERMTLYWEERIEQYKNAMQHEYKVIELDLGKLYLTIEEQLDIDIYKYYSETDINAVTIQDKWNNGKNIHERIEPAT